MSNQNDDLQRYLDILFADYRESEPARRLRTKMLDRMLREKERMRAAGMSEKDAVARILNRVGHEDMHGEGSLLIYTDRFARDSAWSLFLWSLTGLVFSVPLLALGRPFFPILLLVVTLLAALWAWHFTSKQAVEDVSFYSSDSTRKLARILWIAFGAQLVLLTVVAFFPPSGAKSYLSVVNGAVRVARFYQPWLLVVFPLWATGLRRLLMKNEVKH